MSGYKPDIFVYIKSHYFVQMLQLENIDLVQFRNHLFQQLHFTKKITGICGANGTGKTNILDAIYYLCFCKSYFNRTDASNATHNYKGFRIEGNFSIHDNTHNTVCILRENNKKEFYYDNEEYKKFSKHIGQLPCVFIAPDDIELITGSSELRRKFIDIILSQTDTTYITNLIEYNSLLQQRNNLLKQYAITSLIDDTLFDIVSEQLCTRGDYIYTIRKEFFETFLPKVNSYYNVISNDNDDINCQYQSQLHSCNMSTLLQQNRINDFALQRTTSGIHKDDIELTINNIKFKNEASQGQRKSLLFSLKLSEWQTIKEQKGFYPILLLDDLFEKLDATRMNSLLQIVIEKNQCQIFITDTHKERLEQELNKFNTNFDIIEL